MLLKTFFIILAAFLVYYFGFYPDSEKTISGEQTTQNPQLWNAKKINFQISLGDNQYRLQAKKIEALNEEKYSIQRVQLAIADGWSIQAQQAILENKNLELLQNIKGKWENYLLQAKKINIQLDEKETHLRGDFSIINDEEQNNNTAKKIKLSSNEALLKNNVVILPKKIIVQFGENSLQADAGILEKDRLQFKGNVAAQLEIGELQADAGILEKDRSQFKGNVSVQSEEIEIKSQEIIYLTTTNKLQSNLPFSFFKKQEKINITGNSFLYDITKKSLQLKK